MHTVLENSRVKLVPLEMKHWQVLWPIATQIDLHAYGTNDVSTVEKLKDYLHVALKEAQHQKSIPYLIYDRSTNTVVGCTRFGNMDFKNKTLHIGWTWISPLVQGTGLNHQMKFLMLAHAFETLQFYKVEFRIDERNIASRKAVEKLGARLEGILRQNLIVKNGFRRSSCCYGILKEEWAVLKASKFKGLDSKV
ncbi:GNAT family N-acetyltransferase [Maribacter chungangensis]|uniref:GNAT family N-acetyltransferase n=1 Tax=Maribacter chungangensis TaxID=1069117 RepID=A0ABW3B3K5_9FLAO